MTTHELAARINELEAGALAAAAAGDADLADQLVAEGRAALAELPDEPIDAPPVFVVAAMGSWEKFFETIVGAVTMMTASGPRTTAELAPFVWPNGISAGAAIEAFSMVHAAGLIKKCMIDACGQPLDEPRWMLPEAVR